MTLNYDIFDNKKEVSEKKDEIKPATKMSMQAKVLSCLMDRQPSGGGAIPPTSSGDNWGRTNG